MHHCTVCSRLTIQKSEQSLGAQGINSPSAAKCNQTPGVSTLKSSWICVGYRSEHITSFDRWLYFSFQRGRGEGKESQGTHAQQSFEYGPKKAGWGIFLSSGHTLRRTERGGFRPLELGPCWLWHWKKCPLSRWHPYHIQQLAHPSICLVS